jgi:hypothetical protein
VRRSSYSPIWAALAAFLFSTACTATESRPVGVSRFISFSVSAVYPNSFDISAGAYRSLYGSFSVEKLKDAWRKKALEVAKGRKFKTSAWIVRETEDSSGGWPIKFRSVSATITLID